MADWSSLRALLVNTETSVTVAWDELDGLVGGVPRSSYVHNALWKGERSGWPGFTTSAVQVGELVTFVRRGAGFAVQAPAEVVRAADSGIDLVLIGCVKKKLNVPASARELCSALIHRR